jgi:hypothetical protein
LISSGAKTDRFRERLMAMGLVSLKTIRSKRCPCYRQLLDWFLAISLSTCARAASCAAGRRGISSRARMAFRRRRGAFSLTQKAEPRVCGRAAARRLRVVSFRWVQGRRRPVTPGPRPSFPGTKPASFSYNVCHRTVLSAPLRWAFLGALHVLLQLALPVHYPKRHRFSACRLGLCFGSAAADDLFQTSINLASACRHAWRATRRQRSYFSSIPKRASASSNRMTGDPMFSFMPAPLSALVCGSCTKARR